MLVYPTLVLVYPTFCYHFVLILHNVSAMILRQIIVSLADIYQYDLD